MSNNYIMNIKQELYKINMNFLPIFLCIGSSNIVGDSFGPKIGSILVQNGIKNVYGTINNSVNSKNLNKTIKFIKKTHKNAFIIAIDAGLGKYSDIGKIKVNAGGLLPRSAIDNSFEAVGSMHILGIVGEFLSKKSTVEDLSKSCAFLIDDLAKKVANEIIEYFMEKEAK